MASSIGINEVFLPAKSVWCEITRLQNLFEKIGAYEALQDFLLIHGSGLGFHALRDPAAAFWLGQVHEVHANRPAVIAARFVGGFPGQIEVGGFERL